MTDSKREYYIKNYRYLLVAIGLATIGLSVAQLVHQPFDPRWIALCVFAAIGSWIAASQIPGAMAVVTVSDTFIFLTLLLCGPEMATLVAAVAVATESARYTKHWLPFASNVAFICCSFSLSSLLMTTIFGDLRRLANHSDTFFIYVLALGLFAALQAFINSLLVVTVISLRTGKRPITAWREGYSCTIVTYFSGMVTAAFINALVHYYGFAAVSFTIPLLLANYLIYRPYVKNIETVREHIADTRALHMRTLEAFATAVDAKDQITHEHVQRVQVYAEGLAQLLGLSEKEIEALRAGALLHDIGKLAVPDYILNKPGKLTAAEFDKMKIHTIVGAQIIERINFPYPLVPVVRHHHERWDGNGYPDGLKGEDIPITARVLTVVDCFDAVREDRQYRKGMTREEAIELLRRDKSKHYDPEIVDMFIENLPVFEARIAEMKKGAHVFTPLTLDETEAIRKAKPAAGLAEDQPVNKPAEQPAEYLQTIRAAHQASREIFELYETAQTVTGSLDVDSTLAIVVSKLERIIPFETCVVYLHDDDRRVPVARYVTGLHSESFRDHTIQPGEGVTGWVMANSRPFANTDPVLDLNFLGDRAKGYRTLAIYPLAKGERQFGALAVYSQSLAAYSEEQLRTLERIASLTSDALQNAMLYAETHTKALTDSLTGLPNSRYLQTVFEQEQARHTGQLSALTLLTMDLDNFKQVNTAIGHKLGDQLLKEIAGLIREQLRRQDTMVRYAGNEFIALLQHTPQEAVSEIACRIQSVIADHHPAVLDGTGVTLGLSVGRAQFGDDGRTLEQLLDAAEARLQADKAARRALNQFDATHREAGTTETFQSIVLN